MYKYAIAFVLFLGAIVVSCSNISSSITRHNTCHAKCLHEEHTHNYSQVGSVCVCNPKGK